MKTLIFLTFAFSCISVSGQDTTYFTNDSREVKSFAACHYYQVITPDANDPNNAVLKEYYKSGKIRAEQNVFYKDKMPQFIGGKIKEWYDNGQLRREYNYKGALNLDGEITTYYKNGKLKRKDIYNDGKLVEGHCYSEDGIEVRHSDFIVESEFPGGSNALISFLLKNLKYPPRAKKNNIEGKVYVRFMVEIDGSITEATVVKPVDVDLDKEALRIVNKMPKWSPYRIDGELKATYFILPVSFLMTDN